MIGLRGSVHTDMGAYMRTNGPVCPKNTCQMLAGPYRIPHVDVESHLWMTNKTPIGTYRGPGRFEPCFYMERMVDIVAEDLGLDRIEFRRKNLIRADEQPYQIVTVQPSNISDEYDSGDYRSTLERALQEIDWPRVSALQGREIDGKLHGVGISCFLEGGAAGPKETARLEVDQNGKIAVSVGSSSVGQGVETVFAQIAADALGLPLESISGVSHGSTTVVSDGYGSFHCRSTVMAGSALVDASEKFLETLRAVVVKRNGAEVDKIELDGESVAAGGQRLPLKEFAGIRVEGEFINKKHTYSFGTQAAHITVDPKTGKIDIIDYVVVEDIGRVVNPLTVSGQVIGALVQGLGGSVLEELKYDENGQLLTGSLADYLLPTATDFPNLRCVVLGEYPSPINPLGVKGVGEGGIIGSGGCIANAVGNALHKIAEQPRSLPLTSGAIWKLVQAGRSGAVAA
jgi:carbon-monoxide dehydrogenase large subunit